MGVMSGNPGIMGGAGCLETVAYSLVQVIAWSVSITDSVRLRHIQGAPRKLRITLQAISTLCGKPGRIANKALGSPVSWIGHDGKVPTYLGS